jgi:SAM-dependent methyltransferase
VKKSKEEIKKAVKQHYGQAVAQRSGCCCGNTTVQIDENGAAPDGVASFGCGTPLTLADIKEGDTVLDLGSGAGPDLIAAARLVGENGKVIGLDMTPEMIEVCRANLEKAGVGNAEVRQGEMESIPVADNEIDWIISNCVINLSPEKEKVFAEAYRVLRPGGQMLVSDIVTINLPESVREDMGAWVGCVAGAVEQDEYISLAKAVGFEDVRIVNKHLYDDNALNAFDGSGCGCGSNKSNTKDAAESLSGRIASVRLYARKPD